MKNIVYIVHCIDTEGPLYESLEATFERISQTFGINIEPSYDNLKKLQNQELRLSGKEEAVANLVHPKRLKYNDTWSKIDKILDEITSDVFRNEFLDSFNNGWVHNWFCLDHIGITGENPRRRDIGFHNIFDHYVAYMKQHNITQDMTQWHFHPLSLRKDAHRSGTEYVSSQLPFEILARRIIDRMWFPTAYRPGFHTERPDSNWFLEQWIPFDYANQSVKGEPTDQPDLTDGRFGDWRRAPNEWKVYHPDHDDYQKEGNCRRWIARCLNIEARLREIQLEDIRDGFERADSGKPTIISFTNHDFRDMRSEINKVRNMIKIVAKEFKSVKFKFSNAVEAMRGVIKTKELVRPDFTVFLEKKKKSAIFKIESKNSIFGPQPFFALKTKTDRYYWQNLDFHSKNQWSYTFDYNTLGIESIEKIGISANTDMGITEIVVYDVMNERIAKKILNEIN